MKIYTLGPVQMFPYTLEESAKQIPYFRTNEFSQIVLESEKLIKEFTNASEEDKVILLTCSGTGAMEASIINCLTKEDHVLVIDGGSFGHRFVKMCELHEIPHEVIKLDRDEALTQAHLDVYKDMDLTALLVNIDETSTSQLYPIDMLSEFCQKKNMYFIVDAISSFLADPFDFTKYHVDIMITSSQKALALAPGLSFVLVSERMLKERVEKIQCPVMYLDFKDHLLNAKRGQTPFTPAVGIVHQLHDRLKHIEAAGGAAKEVERVKTVAEDFRERAKELPMRLPAYPMSNACTALIFDNGRAHEIYEVLKEKYDLVVTPSGGDLANYIIRVGHIGNHTIEDNIELVETMKKILNS